LKPQLKITGLPSLLFIKIDGPILGCFGARDPFVPCSSFVASLGTEGQIDQGDLGIIRAGAGDGWAG